MSEEDEKVRTWAKRHGVKWHEVNPGPHNFMYLVEPRNKQLASSLGRKMRPTDLFDHPRPFGKRLPRFGDAPRYWAVITNPYTHHLEQRYGSEDARNEAIRDVAGQLGLSVRIGDPTDTTYWGKLPTTPILWWNPKGFDPAEVRG
jgi:hypothetical protein